MQMRVLAREKIRASAKGIRSFFCRRTIPFTTGHADLPGEMQTTVVLKTVSCGTEMAVTQEGIPAVIPTEQCYLGWQQSLVLLAHLVEAEIAEM